MRTAEIRRIFLSFFEGKGHKILPSSSVVPQDDPTLLFVNAGMVQFKRYFLGEAIPPYLRAATVQKCIRAGGKHSDLENVGKTARHHTFFEMLGNFSFGDYFKGEAILWAWELVTEIFGLEKDKLYITVYKEDDEAYDIWAGLIPEGRIYRMGEEDNFWAMGETGPCGPCSEIIYDTGSGCGKADCGIGCDCDRFLEIWNLVFMEFDRTESGEFVPLPKKNIDTGMGLERIASVLQGVPSNFHIDIFLPAREKLEGIVKDETAIRVILDAVRCVLFAAADGILPSNEGRGYVIRRILRRALRYGMLNGVSSPFLSMLANPIVENTGDFWPHIKDSVEFVKDVIREEERRFFDVTSRSLPAFEREIESITSKGLKEIPGEVIFTFWDTHGLPVDFMEEVAQDYSLGFDKSGFEKIMEERRKKSRIRIAEITTPGEKTIFTGYENLEDEGVVKRILTENGVEKDKGVKGEKIIIVVDRTPFYPEGGGQVGDTGLVEGKGGMCVVEDTRRLKDAIAHFVRIEDGEIFLGERVKLVVDRKRRLAVAAHHTSTHLLHSALRKVLSNHARQMGSLVAADRLRFDFSHPKPLSQSEVEEIEDLVAEWIMQDHEVIIRTKRYEDAIREGALAFFGDRYGDVVRVVQIGNISKELCGGTHLKRTGEAGLLKIVSESSAAAGIRRIEAVVGFKFLEIFRAGESRIMSIAEMLGTSKGEIETRVQAILKRIKELERENESLRSQLTVEPVYEEVDGVKLVFASADGLSKRNLGTLVDLLREKYVNALVFAMSSSEGKVIFTCGSTCEIPADLVVKEIGKVLGGGGGGRKDFAEGGGKRPKPQEEVIKALREFIKQRSS